MAEKKIEDFINYLYVFDNNKFWLPQAEEDLEVNFFSRFSVLFFLYHWYPFGLSEHVNASFYIVDPPQ